MKKRKHTIVLAAACFLLLGFMALLGLRISKQDAALAAEAAEAERFPVSSWKVSYKGKEYSIGSSAVTYLLVGTDQSDADEFSGKAAGFYNHIQADVIMLLAVDEPNRSLSVIQINRDTMTDVPWLDVIGQHGGTVYQQIALSYNSASGGTDSLAVTAEAVSSLLFGIPVDHSAAFSMEGICVLNDLVGGVTVKLRDDLTAVDKELIKGNTVTLRGEQAEHFLRARMALSDDSNSARMARHRDYLEGFVQSAKIAAEENPKLFPKAVEALTPYLVTDMTQEQLRYLADCVQKYGIDTIAYADGELRLGEFYEFYPDMDSLWSIVCETYHIR